MSEAKNCKNTDPEMDKAVDELAKMLSKYFRETLGDLATKEFFEGVVEFGKRGMKDEN